MSERYLITGGAGNLACQLTFSLARLGDSITIESPAAGVLDDILAPEGTVVALGQQLATIRPA